MRGRAFRRLAGLVTIEGHTASAIPGAGVSVECSRIPLAADRLALASANWWRSAPAAFSTATWLQLAAVTERPSGTSDSTAEPAPTTSSSQEDDFMANATAQHGPVTLYKEGRLSKQYSKDARQEATILQLQRLYEGLAAALGGAAPERRSRRSGLTLVDHKDKAESHTHWWDGITRVLEGRSRQPAKPDLPPGLYMYGGVGVGKTMLMDLLVKCAPSQFQLRRMHFHDFMLDVHSWLRHFSGAADPLIKVADEFTKRMRVLCLDEFFVTDVADAAVLSRLFGRMWENGLVLVATSNRPPKNLYEGGLQRDLFLPFIAKLEKACTVHDMNSTTDYRKRSHYRRGLWFAKRPYRPDPTEVLRERFYEMIRNQSIELAPRTLKVQMGRTIKVPQAGGPFALMTFDDLCGQPVAAADYIALANEFHTLAIEDVPVFTASLRPQAYRCVTLIDVLYEHRIRVFASSTATPLELFENVVTQANARSKGTTELTIVDDELAFASDRTVSRLTEMQSASYLAAHAKQHAPHLLLALEEASADKDQPSGKPDAVEPEAATA